ncbi:MAG: hypothetical protein QOJ90_2439 [Actinomycetota bacterium]|jgi:hypothetical protein|nr:hypothetical protein [Actinomycetota bacterium]MDQ1643088.1 hypothetical protein [Actinomycetota bacterium]
MDTGGRWRAASAFIDDGTGVGTLCIHALDDDGLPLCRDVKVEDLTATPRPWDDWLSSMKCKPCEAITNA